MKKFLSLLVVVLSCFNLPAQESPGSSLSITGYTRATGFIGIYDHRDPTLKSLYNETSLKLKAKTGRWGQAYTDIRFRAGTEYGTDFSVVDIHEAYLDLFFGKLDFRIGKQ
ncbi:MAG: hypothetical protein PHY99_09845, partial [Bacteroidales bacterium]|nr:hypothetical protein [Bacteroidales bacterium]